MHERLRRGLAKGGACAEGGEGGLALVGWGESGRRLALDPGRKAGWGRRGADAIGDAAPLERLR